jgi:hypothetical protein
MTVEDTGVVEGVIANPDEKIRGTFAIFVREKRVFLAIHTDITGDVVQQVPSFFVKQLTARQPELRDLLGL